MKTIIYTKLDKRLIDEWKGLWEKSESANYINGPQWLSSVLSAFNYKDYKVITVYKNTELLAVAALVKIKKYGIKLYTLPEGDYVCGMPFLFDSENAGLVKCLFEEIKKIDNLLLENVPESFGNILIRQGLNINKNYSSMNFFLGFTRNEKGEIIIRKRNHLMGKASAIENKFSLKIYKNNKDILETIFKLDSKSTKHDLGYNTFDNEKTKNFFKAIIKNFGNSFLVNILYFEDKPVAYEMGFISREVYYGCQIAMVGGYRKYSLGRILTIKLIEKLNRDGINKFDFGSGDDHVKRSFTKESVALYDIVVSNSALTRLYLSAVLSIRKYFYEQLSGQKITYKYFKIVKKVLGSKTKI